MKKLTIMLTLALLSLALVAVGPFRINKARAAAPQGQVLAMADAGIQFQVPRGWKSKRDADGVYLSTADEALQVVFFVPDADTFDVTLRTLDKELGRTIK